jgi:hypothetical protein
MESMTKILFIFLTLNALLLLGCGVNLAANMTRRIFSRRAQG